jgi:hypothetical protein
MNRDNFETVLIVKPHGERDIYITAILPESDPEHFETIIKPGESFGGHDHDEWRAVAIAKGFVSADWLKV